MHKIFKLLSKAYNQKTQLCIMNVFHSGRHQRLTQILQLAMYTKIYNHKSCNETNADMYSMKISLVFRTTDPIYGPARQVKEKRTPKLYLQHIIQCSCLVHSVKCSVLSLFSRRKFLGESALAWHVIIISLPVETTIQVTRVQTELSVTLQCPQQVSASLLVRARIKTEEYAEYAKKKWLIGVVAHQSGEGTIPGIPEVFYSNEFSLYPLYFVHVACVRASVWCICIHAWVLLQQRNRSVKGRKVHCGDHVSGVSLQKAAV